MTLCYWCELRVDHPWHDNGTENVNRSWANAVTEIKEDQWITIPEN
jgi:hypothetical protein